MRDVITRDGEPGQIQIGRQAPLTPQKHKTHFPFIHRATGISYDEMLYFDDDVWYPHTELIADELGVLGVATPAGLTEELWEFGLSEYARLR
mmetsp:Transcript_52159/g.71200  ORF Transcript_52159/g.71200 Transcript_52159/m.71200 type:complete len:92 (+) Transcript_52159:3-278(+)